MARAGRWLIVGTFVLGPALPSCDPGSTTSSPASPQAPATTTAGPVSPSHSPGAPIELLPDGISSVRFGDPIETALSAFIGRFGAPDEERAAHDPDLWGYLADGPDVDGRIHLATWGPLTVVFLDRSGTIPPAGIPFAAWTMNASGDGEPALTTPEGIGLGSTLADLEAAYPDTLIVPDEPGGPCAISWVFDVDTGEGTYRGTFEDRPVDPGVMVTAIAAGAEPSC